ncbi:MAG: bifunctional precorrin-2 dehydrogenase/sirohydrochlorin ferrochelatase [Aristaeellaceae bacterium]
MSSFPMCIDLDGRDVYLIGSGEQIRDKAQKLSGFGANLIQRTAFTRQDAETQPAMVIVGDEAAARAEAICRLCRTYGIPVNVVDVPAMCTFFFPAMIRNGDLTVSVSTGGKCPGFAAALRARLEAAIPGRAGEILQWLQTLRPEIRSRPSPQERRRIVQALIRQSLTEERPLTAEETDAILRK